MVNRLFRLLVNVWYKVVWRIVVGRKFVVIDNDEYGVKIFFYYWCGYV